MYDPELLVELLREMNNADDGSGSLLEPQTFKSNPKRRHHLDLLEDAGQALWNDKKSSIRITKDGYDFLNAIDKGRDTWDKFLEYLEKGMSYLAAVQKAIELLDNLTR